MFSLRENCTRCAIGDENGRRMVVSLVPQIEIWVFNVKMRKNFVDRTR